MDLQNQKVDWSRLHLEADKVSRGVEGGSPRGTNDVPKVSRSTSVLEESTGIEISARMLELMSWSEVVENLRLEGNLRMACVFDLEAEKVAESGEGGITCTEAAHILASLGKPTVRIYGLFIRGIKYSCFCVDPDTIIGHAERTVIVASKTRDVLVCALSDDTAPVSCLGTVKAFMEKLGLQQSQAAVPDLMAPIPT